MGRQPSAGYGRGARGLVLLGAMLVLLLFGAAGPASAHAALRGSDPADGSVVKSPPRYITLTFTESVNLLDDSLRVLDPGNKRVGTGKARHAPGRSDTARVSLPAGLGTGTFTVAWRVVSADSHPVSGALTFSVGKPSPTPPPVPTDPVENPATGSLYDIAAYAAYLAAALLIGTTAFAALCRPPSTEPLRGLLRLGWWTLAASTVVLLLLRGPYEAGTDPTTAFDAQALHRTLTTRPGVALLARLGLLLPAALLLRRGRVSRATVACGTAVSVALSLTWAASDHASAGVQVPVAMLSTVLHLLAMAVWLGGLTALLVTLYRTPPDSALPVTAARFSRLAFISVTVLVATGVYQSWRGLGSWQALTGTSYGRLLLVKVAAVTLLLGAAGVSRRWTGRLARAGVPEAVVRERVPESVGGPPRTPEAPSPPSVRGPLLFRAAASGVRLRGLRRSVAAEVTVGVVVLVITTVLSSTPPGRAAAEEAGVAGSASTAGGLPVASVTTIPFDIATAGVHGRVQVTLDPGRVGTNSVEAVVYGPDGGFATVPELRVTLTLPGEQIGPLDTKVRNVGGYWGASAFNVPLPGTWTMKATVRVSELDQVTVSKQVTIAR